MAFNKLKKLMAEQLSLDEEIITEEATFDGDLGIDSLDVVELMMAIEEEFELEELGDEDLSRFTTVGDVLAYIQSKLDV